MTEPFDAVLAEMLGESTLFLHEITDYHTRLAAAHAAEVAERDARIERLFAANEQVMARAEAAERDARELRDAHKRLAGMWRAEANDLAFPDEDERPIVEAEDAMRRLHADQLDKAIATTEQADED